MREQEEGCGRPSFGFTSSRATDGRGRGQRRGTIMEGEARGVVNDQSALKRRPTVLQKQPVLSKV